MRTLLRLQLKVGDDGVTDVGWRMAECESRRGLSVSWAVGRCRPMLLSITGLNADVCSCGNSFVASFTIVMHREISSYGKRGSPFASSS